MQITLKLDGCPIKQGPYLLNPKYKKKVREEIHKMTATSIIEPVKQLYWVSPMVVQEKKTKGEIRICIDLRKLNDACVHDPFPMPFSDEIIDSVGGQEEYSFTDGFSGYHQIRIAPEDHRKTMFATKWGSFQYTVMPFGLKNSPAIFSWVVVAVFKDFIHKFLQAYFDGWTIFVLVKKHISNLCMMLDVCIKHQISLNINKWIFFIPSVILLGHIICQQGLMVDPTKVEVVSPP